MTQGITQETIIAHWEPATGDSRQFNQKNSTDSKNGASKTNEDEPTRAA